jgi:monoterpene epsilon-lactone hydrolase
MSLLMSVAKLYARIVFRKEDETDSIGTQKKLSLPHPPRHHAPRCRKTRINDVSCVWIDEANAKNGVLVYLHGGIYYFGPVKEHWDYIADMSKRTKMAALVIDYGMAPQRPFPAGIDDIVKVVSAADLPGNWFFLGDSSGAAMAVGAVFKLKENGGILPKKLMLMSPWMDITLENPDIKLNEHEDPMMTVKRMLTAAREYAGQVDLKDPLISPMFGDLNGLPPILIQIGTSDLLLWDAREFHQKCLDAGVEAVYEEYPHGFHDFMMLGFLPESKKALQSQADFLTS